MHNFSSLLPGKQAVSPSVLASLADALGEISRARASCAKHSWLQRLCLSLPYLCCNMDKSLSQERQSALNVEGKQNGWGYHMLQAVMT